LDIAIQIEADEAMVFFFVSYYSASCHFEAVGREIPRAQEVKAAWLDKIY
jgi:hypothetical protein